MLNEKGISYAEPAGNAGRIIIAPKELEAFLMRHDSEQIWTSLSQHISFRYVMVIVLVLVSVVAKYRNLWLPLPSRGTVERQVHLKSFHSELHSL